MEFADAGIIDFFEFLLLTMIFFDNFNDALLLAFELFQGFLLFDGVQVPCERTLIPFLLQFLLVKFVIL